MSNAEKARLWNEYIAEQKASGLTIERWCRENNILSYQFHYWKAKQKPPSEVTRTSFTELLERNNSLLFFECKGVRLHIDRSCDLNFLKECLRALREASC